MAAGERIASSSILLPHTRRSERNVRLPLAACPRAHRNVGRGLAMAKLARDISAYACRRKSQRKLPPGPPLRRSATILVHMAEVTRTLGLLHDVEATARGEAGPLVPMLLRLLHGQPRWSFGTVLYEGDETVAFHWTSWADLLEAALGHPKALRLWRDSTATGSRGYPCEARQRCGTRKALPRIKILHAEVMQLRQQTSA